MTRDSRSTRSLAPAGLIAGALLGAVTGYRYWRERMARKGSPLTRGGERQVALVTGASSGIGREYARQLAALGYEVILVARRTERLEALAAEIESRHQVHALVVTADLSTEDGIQRVERVLANTDNLGVLVNNAGLGLNGVFADLDVDDHTRLIELHVAATVRLTRAALPAMLEQKRGAIVNVASLMAFYPLYGSSTYGATKCYLRSFTEALHQELVGTGVRAQALCPGFVETEMQEAAGIDPIPLPDAFWMSCETVVARSLRDLARDRVVSVAGLGYQVLAAISGWIPRTVLYVTGRALGRSRGK